MSSSSAEESLLQKKTIKNESDPLPIRNNSKKRCRGDKEETAAASDDYYRGVRRRTWGRYVSEIRIPKMKTRIWLGSFDSPEMAARAYDSAAFYLKGKSASLNFPDLAGTLPRPQSSTRRDIQIAAAKAAAAASDDVTVNRIELDREPLKDARPVSGSNEQEQEEEEASWWLLDDDELACIFDDVLPLEEEEEKESEPPLGCSTATATATATGGGVNYYSSSSNQMLC